MTAIIKWTLLQRRWSIFWWSVASFGLIFINMIFYPSFKNDAAELQKSFESIPETTLQFIGGSADFFSPVGFLNSQIFFLMLPLLLGVLAISLGSNLLAREEQDGTAEILLSRPISRNKLLLAKALAGTAILAWATLVALTTTVVTSALVDLEVSTIKIIQATAVCFLLTFSFGAIAFVLTALGRARGASMGIATTIALGGYVISSLSGTVEWLKIPAKALPFTYYQPEPILRGTHNWNNVAFFIAIVSAVAIISWLSFRRRDLR